MCLSYLEHWRPERLWSEATSFWSICKKFKTRGALLNFTCIYVVITSKISRLFSSVFVFCTDLIWLSSKSRDFSNFITILKFFDDRNLSIQHSYETEKHWKWEPRKIEAVRRRAHAHVRARLKPKNRATRSFCCMPLSFWTLLL